MNEWLGRLCEWFENSLSRLEEFTTLERIELLLCSSDLGVNGPQVSAAVTKLGIDEENPPGDEDSIFYSLARQMTLLKFGSREDLRKKFIDRWINEEGFRGQNIVTISFTFSLGLEQPKLVDDQMRRYVQNWHLKHSFTRSDRFAAWSCYCLTLCGHNEEAQRRTRKLLNKREANGSWSYELRRTIGCSYPLALASLVEVGDLVTTLKYIQKRLTLGYTGDIATNSQALKLMTALDLLEEERKSMMRRRARDQGSIFLSHNSADKPFVRKLTRDLKEHGLRVWLDEAELLPGDSLFEKIEAAVEDMQYLGIVLSPSSVASSWVRKELRMAQVLDLGQKDVKIIPILLEECTVPLSLRELLWADFRDDYAVGFASMLRRLALSKAAEPSHSNGPSTPLHGSESR